MSTKQSEITHLISSEGERIEMSKPLRIRGATEQWLLALENSMFETVKKHLKVLDNYFIFLISIDEVIKIFRLV